MITAALKGAEPKKRMSTTGSVTRLSTAMNAIRPSIARTIRPSTSGESQPLSGPSIRAPTVPPRKAMMSSWPAGSRRRGLAALDSGTNTTVATRAAVQTGTFIQKVASQPKDSVRNPPRSGPDPNEMPMTAPHTPMARARWAGSV